MEGGTMHDQDKKRVLIVDNDECVLRTLQTLLENADFDTETTWSGHEALALLQSQHFDVLLVDDYLPDLHASDFLNRVGRLLACSRIVVMQAAVPSATCMQRYMSLGADAVVRKHHLAEVCDAVSSMCHEPLVKMRPN
jgi:CheY-like chemotaxis protein